jgi:hypothetical protein
MGAQPPSRRPRRWSYGALLAAERRNPDFLALHDEVTSAHIRPIVPVVVLAQAWRGGPQRQISRVLKGCDILSDDQATGRAAGVACAASGTADVVDAIVIATARPPPGPRRHQRPRRPDAHRRLHRRQNTALHHLNSEPGPST